MISSAHRLVLTPLLFLGIATPAWAALPSPVATYTLPAPSSVSFSTSATFGPDGKLYAYDGLNLFSQNAINGSAFTKISTADAPVAGSDAGPIAFTRDGATIIVGTGAGGIDFTGNSNGKFLTIPAGGGTFTTLSGTVSNQYAFAALPSSSTVANSGNKLAVDFASANFATSGVSYFDRSTGSNTPVISGIPGASTEVAFDNAGHLYVGVGSGASRGTVERFDVSALDNAFNTNTPLAFSAGTLLNSANNNSGNGFFVSAAGLVFVGSGSDGGFITIAPDLSVQSYDLGGSFPSIRYNAFNDHFAVLDTNFATGITTASVYNAASFIPEPASVTMIVLVFGTALVTRRRAA